MIMRGDHSNNYLIIQNEALRDPELSLEARGLLAYMLTFADDWQFSLEGIKAQTGIGTQKAVRLVKELQAAGYLIIKTQIKKNGQFGGAVWELRETPDRTSDNRTRLNRTTANRTPCNRTSVFGSDKNNHIKNNHIKNNQIEDIYSTGPSAKIFKKPTLEEVRAYCQERGNSVNPEKWYDHYTSNGWKVGKNPMKDWKAAVRTWERSGYNDAKKTETYPKANEQNKMDEALRIAMQRAEGGAV